MIPFLKMTISVFLFFKIRVIWLYFLTTRRERRQTTADDSQSEQAGDLFFSFVLFSIKKVKVIALNLSLSQKDGECQEMTVPSHFSVFEMCDGFW